ncbi:MAG: hypothetical protein ABI581_03515, partial [Sediminibacterium sp.]
MSDAYKIIPVTIDDSKRLSVFLSTHTQHFCDRTRWNDILEWMWKANPFVEADTKLGWAIEDGNQSICGFIGNVPVKYSVAGELLPAVFGTSWYVDEKAKDLALKLYINFTRQKEMIFSNTQTPRVEVVMQKMGFKEIPANWYTSAYVLPLHVFNRAFFKNIFIEPSFKKLGVGLFGTGIRLLKLFSTGSGKDFGEEVLIQKIDEFPSNTDEWFSGFANEQDCTLLRDKKTYSWLFCQAQSENLFLKYQVSYKGLLQGFLIFKRKSLKGFNYIEIVDEALLP